MIIINRLKWIIGISAAFTILFCCSFVYFYKSSQPQMTNQFVTSPDSIINKTIPDVSLLDSEGRTINSKDLKIGKRFLVLVLPGCKACDVDGEFLSTVIEKRKDIQFYGIIPFGDKALLGSAKDKFPFRTYFDKNRSLYNNLKINKVPTKLYIEDGVIKKAWIGSITTQQSKDEFMNWLDKV